MVPDREVKLMFINRQKRLFNNILRQLENSRVTTEEQIQQFKAAYNEIVFEDAKKAYLEHKTRNVIHKEFYDDLFCKVNMEEI